jgi:hypothetical protein
MSASAKARVARMTPEERKAISAKTVAAMMANSLARRPAVMRRRRAAKRAWYAKNAARLRAKSQVYRDANRERVNAAARRRYAQKYGPANKVRRAYLHGHKRTTAPWLQQAPKLYQGKPVANPLTCKHGHPLDDKTMSFHQGGHVRCLACARSSHALSNSKRKHG